MLKQIHDSQSKPGRRARGPVYPLSRDGSSSVSVKVMEGYITIQDWPNALFITNRVVIVSSPSVLTVSMKHNSYSSEDLRFISLSYFPRNNKTSKAVWTSFPSLSSRPCCCLTHLIGAKSNFWSPCETSKYLTHELLLQDCSTTIDLHPFF